MKKENKQPAATRDLLVRTKRFALDSIRLYTSLPPSVVHQILGKQMLRSATSVGAHYREAQRAKSGADFVSKIEGALQELDETRYWLELIHDTLGTPPERHSELTIEAEELLRILVSIAKTAKATSRRKLS